MSPRVARLAPRFAARQQAFDSRRTSLRTGGAGLARPFPRLVADPSRPVGINPAGATRDGHSIDGVLPDDQRRGGPFVWPPPRENYVYEALQGAIVEAVILSRAGYDVWNWSDRALLRAYTWLRDQAQFPPQGDDTWQMPILDRYYGTRYWNGSSTRPGKNMGWTDWTHGSR